MRKPHRVSLRVVFDNRGEFKWILNSGELPKTIVGESYVLVEFVCDRGEIITLSWIRGEFSMEVRCCTAFSTSSSSNRSAKLQFVPVRIREINGFRWHPVVIHRSI